jgi:hypothetical protein
VVFMLGAIPVFAFVLPRLTVTGNGGIVLSMDGARCAGQQTKESSMTKIAQQIADAHSSSTDAMEAAELRAIGKDQVWSMEMTKYTFDDNSVLAVRGPDHFGFDADSLDSIGAYKAWLGSGVDGSEAAEIERLLEALEA